MKMSISKKERDLLIGLVGILAVVAVWFLYASPTMNNTEALKNENANLRAKSEEYQAIHAMVGDYSNKITEFEAESKAILEPFPSKIVTEDKVMFWANISNAYPDELAFQDLSLSENTPLVGGENQDTEVATELAYDADGNVVVSDNMKSSEKYVLYSAPMTMNYISTYGGMKDMFDYINSQYDKNSIDSVSISYDNTTGLLNGDINVSQYFVTGQDKEKPVTFIPSVPVGQSDIFHTGASDIEGIAENNSPVENSEVAGE